MIEVQKLSKHYDQAIAVDAVSFVVQPGVVTGFLGPNGAGKSTTMRMILGLARPTSGLARVNGHPYADAPAPLHELGALLDARGVDGGRSARNHLRALGATVGIGRRRVEEVLELVGLAEVVGQPVRSYSLGMAQRLGIAGALLGDPGVIMLDEPTNGLDPEGIKWIRDFLRGLAAEGRTVLVSSHLMSEMELTADHLLVIGRGRLLADLPMEAFIAQAQGARVRVSSPDAARLEPLLDGPGVAIAPLDPESFEVTGRPAPEIGAIAARHGLELHELATIAPSLEEAFMDLTREAVQYHGAADALSGKAAA